MKKLIFTILFLQIGLHLLSAQWITQYPYTAGTGLLDIKFINSNTGWICGDGIILKTTNKGTNWVVQNHPAVGKYLYSIHPVDSNIVYCVGYFETILKTTNGGTNWFAIKNGPVGQGNSYRGTCFINSLTGWVVGFRNQIYKTTNGGISFDSTYALAVMNDIHFKDSNTGLIVGDGAMVFKTTNQGITWNKIYLTPNNYGDFNKISVINNQYCFVVEDGKRVYKSTNYGDTWDSIGYVTGANHPYTCRFSSLQTGWVGGTYGEIFKSTNGGATWSPQYVNTTNIGYIWSFGFLSDTVGWAIGGNTKLLYTSTGGATFINNQGIEVPENYKLYQNYPNPFNSQTRIDFEILNRAFVNITVYDLQGKEVQTLVNNEKTTGIYSINFNAQNISSGIYFTRMSINGKSQKIIKMTLIK